MSIRTLQQIIPGIATSDGGGVKLRRSLGQSQVHRVDPFLMLDEFSSAKADDYIAGFPEHPHRGFETITYMLDGHMLHQDHLGNRGDLKGGGAQWMTAGRGIIHSEMPQQESGRMRGFQLWINLPAKEKMKPASYQDIPPEAMPWLTLANGGSIKVIAGSAEIVGQIHAGPIQGMSTDVLFLDIQLPADSHFELPLPCDYNAFVYPYECQVMIGPQFAQQPLPPQQAGVLSLGDQLEIWAEEHPVAFLLLAGRPLGEPVVQHGPFVMNTQAEIEQAIADYKKGQLV